jgi:3'(2'), 5'-bisphosphate nucleotidase
MLEKELEIACSLARAAGAEILKFYASGFRVDHKIGADDFAEPVTEADHASNEIIVAGLQAAFPADGLFSEETPDNAARLTRSRVWIIDPMDGTKGFVNRDNDFAVQIGLAADGEPILGVVYLPFQDVMYYAAKGAGAWAVNDGDAVRLRASARTDLTQMNIAVSRRHRSPKMREIVAELGFKQEIERGSVGLKVGLVAERECDVYLHLSSRTKQWDTCAPQVILEEAGGRLTDLFGGPLFYNILEARNLNGVLATNGAAHEAIVNALKPLLHRFGRRRIIEPRALI